MRYLLAIGALYVIVSTLEYRWDAQARGEPQACIVQYGAYHEPRPAPRCAAGGELPAHILTMPIQRKRK